MGRSKGTALFAVNFEPGGQSPLDARLVVEQLSDLTAPETYADNNVYNGMVVSVLATGGLYMLTNMSAVTEQSSWKVLDSSAISTDLTEIKNNIKILQADVKKVKVSAADASVTVTGGADKNGTKVGVKLSANKGDLELDADGLKVAPYTVDENTMTKSGKKLAVKSGVFEQSGAAAAVKAEIIGTDEDAQSVDTIKGTKKYAKAQADAAQQAAINTAATDATSKSNKALTDAKAYTDTKIGKVNTEVGKKVSSVAAADNSIEVGGTTTAPTVGVKISESKPGILKLEADGLSAVAPTVTPYTGKEAVTVEDHKIALKINAIDKVLSQSSDGLLSQIRLIKIGSPAAGMASQYKLVGKDGSTALGVTIDIAKDQMLTSGEFIASATEEDKTVDDSVIVGDPYIKLVVSLKDDSTKAIYIPTKKLVDIYTAGNGINVVGNAISIKLDPSSEKYVTVGTNGLKISGIDAELAKRNLTAADKSVVVAPGAQGNTVKVNVNPDNNDLTVDAEKGLTVAPYTVDEATMTKTGKKLAVKSGVFEQSGAAAQALKDAKAYTDTEVGKVTASACNQYTQEVTTGQSVTILKTAHKCGSHPMVACYLAGELVDCAISLNASGDITVEWNGSAVSKSNKLTIVVTGCANK